MILRKNRGARGPVRSSRRTSGPRHHRPLAEGLEQRALLSGVGGMVFNDVDRNGIYDGSDIPIPGRTVWVDLDNDGQLDTGEPSGVTSGTQGPNNFGSYRIDGLSNGVTYQVRTVVPADWVQTLPANDAPLTVSFPAGPNNLVTINSNFGTHNTKQTSTLSGKVFGDTNADGVRSSSEFGLANQTVYIDADNDATLDPEELSAVTDA